MVILRKVLYMFGRKLALRIIDAQDSIISRDRRWQLSRYGLCTRLRLDRKSWPQSGRIRLECVRKRKQNRYHEITQKSALSKQRNSRFAKAAINQTGR